MTPQQIIALLWFIVAVILAAVAAFVPAAHPRLIALAVAAASLGAAVEEA